MVISFNLYNNFVIIFVINKKNLKIKFMKETISSWPKQGSSHSKNRTSRQVEMSEYAKNIGKNTRSARAYLRSVGLDISKNGEICNAR